MSNLDEIYVESESWTLGTYCRKKRIESLELALAKMV